MWAWLPAFVTASALAAGGADPALAAGGGIAVAALSHHDWLDDPFLGDRRDQLREIPHHLSRLVGVRLDLFDRDHASDRRSGRRCERRHVMLVVAHGNRDGQPSSSHGR